MESRREQTTILLPSGHEAPVGDNPDSHVGERTLGEMKPERRQSVAIAEGSKTRARRWSGSGIRTPTGFKVIAGRGRFR